MNTKSVRINYSQETLDLLTFFADHEGHGNLSAALATLVKFGVPFLVAQRQGQAIAPLPLLPYPQQPPLALSSFVEPIQEMSGTIEEEDEVVKRFASLLEEF